MATAPVGVFVHAGDLKIAARFNSNAMRFIKAGDPAEVALGTYPGKILEATVADIVPITGEGQLTPSGNLRTSSSFQHPGQLLVLLEFNDDAGGTLASRIQWTAPESGIYFLSVENAEFISTGSYTLTVRVTE